MSFFSFIGDLLAPITGGISALIGNGISLVSNLFHGGGSGSGGILGGIENLFSGGFGNFLKSVDSVTSGITGFIDSAAKTIDAFLSPIQKVEEDIASVANDLQNKLIIPVTSVINTTQREVQGLITGVHNDLAEGLKGIVKIPGTIASALNSIDAVYQRASAELGAHIDASVTDALVPGMLHSGTVPLNDLGLHLLPGEGQDSTMAYVKPTIDLAEGSDIASAEAQMQELMDEAQKMTGILAPIARFLVKAFTGGWAWVGVLEAQREIGLQVGKAANPQTPLSPGEALEATRRGTISVDQYFEECARAGLDKTRANAIYVNANYLFGPRDAVELWYRELIDDATFDVLMNQNNLEGGQPQTLKDLMAFLYGPGDLPTLLARNVIDQGEYERLAKANHMSPQDAEALKILRTQLASPQSGIKASQRYAAANEGLLQDTLRSEPPEAIRQLYAENLVDQKQADFDWLEHWRLPDMAWWIDAYFRQLVTREQLDLAADMNGVPRELVDDMLGVQEELPPVWLVPDIVSTGVWSREQAVPALMKLGFSEENAGILYDYGASKIKTTTAQAANDLSKVTLSTAKSLYDAQAIPRAEYEAILEAHGYSQAAAALTAELADIENGIKQRKSFVDALVNEVKVGARTRGQAEQQLYSAGFPTTEVLAALEKIDAAKVENQKLPSRADLEKMYKAGNLPIEEWRAAMEQIGYNAYWTGQYEALL